MIELAFHIPDSKGGHFEPSKFKDQYEKALRMPVKRRAAGKPVRAAEAEGRAGNVINLMEAPQQSLKGKGRGAASRRAGRAPCIIPPPGKEGAPLL